MKKFLISIDTEGDNLWKWQVGDIVTTENAKYLPRFQSLCEKYGFKPTYLTNYEMAMDSFFIEYFKEVQEAFEEGLPFDMGQILSIPFIIIGVYCMVKGLKKA